MGDKKKNAEERATQARDYLTKAEQGTFESIMAVKAAQRSLADVEKLVLSLPIGDARSELEGQLYNLLDKLSLRENELIVKSRKPTETQGSKAQSSQAGDDQTPKVLEEAETRSQVNVLESGPFEAESEELMKRMRSELVVWNAFETFENRLLPLDLIPPDLGGQLGALEPRLEVLSAAVAELSQRLGEDDEVTQAYLLWRCHLVNQWSALWRESVSQSKDQQTHISSAPVGANTSASSSTSDPVQSKPAMIALPKREIAKFTTDPKSWLSFRRDINLLLEDNHHSKEFRFTALETATKGHPLASSIVSRYAKTSDLKGAIDALTKEFENPVTLLNDLEDYINVEIKRLPESFSSQDIVDFYIHLQYVRQQLDLANSDANTRNKMVRPLQAKLPTAMRIQLRHNHSEFDEFVSFIDEIYEAKFEIASVPKSVKPQSSFKSYQHKPKSRQFGAVDTCHQQTRPKVIERDISTSCVFCPSNSHNSRSCRKSPEDRKRRLRAQGLCYRCLKSYPCYCKNTCAYCNRPHHLLLCNLIINRSPRFENSNSSISQNQSSSSSSVSSHQAPSTSSDERDPPEASVGSFQGAIPVTPDVVYEIKGTPIRQVFWCEMVYMNRAERIRVFVDPGSEVTLLNPNLLTRLAMTSTTVRGMIITGPGSGPRLCTEQVAFRLAALDGSIWCRAQAWVYPQIGAISVPVTPKELIDKARANGVKLSEENTSRVVPDLVIGVDYADRDEFTAKEIRRITPSVIASRLPFGWALRGFYQQELNTVSAQVASYSAVPAPCGCDLLRRVFDLDDDDSKNESKLEIQYDEEQKRFFISLPWIGAHRPNNNFGCVKAQVMSMKKRLEQTGELELYHEAISEFVKADYAEPAEPRFVQEGYYLPHHPVMKPGATKTKCRPVFNASASILNGKSLNQCLSRGEPINCDLNLALVNFRLAQVPLVSDVVKAFLQIRIMEKDRDYLRYFWFEHLEDKEPTLYRLKSLLFGANCSPHILGAVLVKMFHDWRDDFPTLRRTREIVYMDDMILDVENRSQVESVIKETTDLMARGSFALHEWVTVEDVRKMFPHLPFKAHERGQQTKCLGVIWSPDTDKIVVECKVEPPEVVTRRSAMSFFGKLYDPMGLLLPFRVKVRRFAREISMVGEGWDSPIPPEMVESFQHLAREHRSIEVELPRATGRPPSRLLIFCDASKKAYGAVAYVMDDNLRRSLLCAKGKLTPLKRKQKIEIEPEQSKKKDKKQSIPRFELCAAVMGIELYDKLKESPRLANLPCDIFSDSQVTLYRIINSKKLHSEIYVQNRLDRIFELMDDRVCWRFVSSENNPADSLTRGCDIDELAKDELWWNGPDMAVLQEDQKAMRDYKPPPELFDGLGETMEMVESALTEQPSSSGECAAVTLESQPLVEDDKWKAILDLSFEEALERVSALIDGKAKTMDQRNCGKTLKLDKEAYTQVKLWRHVQKDTFKDEYERLRKGRASNDRRLCGAKVYADEWGVLRTQRPLPPVFAFSTRYPIVLAYHKMWKSFVAREHHRLRHPGVNTLHGHLMEQFFVFKGKRMVADFTRRCYHCNLYRGKPFSAPMAPLPVDRTLEATTPFTSVGVDFYGPITIAVNRKVYGLLFACNRTRAIHLEVVTSLATANCVQAFQRFFARRGIPEEIRSDNATTFHASNSVLARLALKVEEAAKDDKIKGLGIRWKFNAPKASWWGGPFERMIGTVKKKLIDVEWKGLSLEGVWTVMCEVEAMVNSRPLFGMSADEPPITPGHFFAGRKLLSLPAVPTFPTPEPILQTYLKLQELLNLIWKRWSSEYILELKRQNDKWKNSREPEVGEWVLINDLPKPRGQWPTAKISKIFPGIDGRVRMAEVQTANGVVYKRAVQHLIPLEASAAGPRQAPEDVVSRHDVYGEVRPDEAALAQACACGLTATTESPASGR